MLKKIPILSIILISTISVLAKNTSDKYEGKNPKDSATYHKANTPSRNAVKFNYIETSQRLSNTIYANNGITATQQATKDSAIAMFRTISTNNAWINTITNNSNRALPFGIRRTIQPQTTIYDVGFNSIKFTKDGAIARVFARVLSNTGSNGEMYFEGMVNLSRTGGVGENNMLRLIGDHSISFDANAYTLQIKGSTGTNTSTFSFNCDGFTSLNLQCNLSLNSTQYFSVNSSFQRENNTAITSNNFNINISQWEDLLKGTATFSNQTFGNSNIPDYFFNIQEATIDLSTLQNPATNNTEISNYINRNTPTLTNTWMGLAITKMDVFLPVYFNSGSGRSKVTASFGIIDGNGFTFIVNNQQNVLTLTGNAAGSANGWPFAITNFSICMLKDTLQNKRSVFSGKLVLPIEDRTYAKRGIPFTAQINLQQTTLNNKTFSFEFVAVNEIDFVSAPNFRGYLMTSKEDVELELSLKNNTIFPKITFSGTFSFTGNRKDENYNVTEAEKDARGEENSGALGTSNEVEMRDIEFQDMVLQTETAPFLKIGVLGSGVKVEIGDHGAEITAEFRATGRTANNKIDANAVCIHFDAVVQLAEGKFNGGIGIDLFCKFNQDTKSFEYETIRLSNLNIKADLGPAASIDGSIDILNNETYGQGFSGSVILRISKSLEVKADIMFGSKPKTSGGRFRYFNIDGSANFRPAGVVIFGVIKITGFSGGFTYKMDAVAPSGNYPVTTTGVSYVPNENSFLRLRAGIHFALVDDAVFSGWGGLEFVFNKSWGLEEVSISGTAQLFSQPINADKNKISPLMEARQQTYMTYKANQGETIEEGTAAPAKNSQANTTNSNRKLSVNYLAPSSITNTNTPLAIADTISVVARIQFIKDQLKTSIADSAFIKASIDSLNFQKSRAEAIMATMQRRSDSISNPQNSTAARDFSFFSGTDLSRINNLFHNSYRFKQTNEWQQVCTLLNIPFIQNDILKTRRATYSLPSQNRINSVRDSLRVVFRNNNAQSLQSIYNEKVSFFTKKRDSAIIAQLSQTQIVQNRNNQRTLYGYIDPLLPLAAITNNNVRNQWKAKENTFNDSINLYNTLRTDLSNQSNQVIPIIAVLSDSIIVPNVGWQPNFSITTNRGIINGINRSGTRFTLLNEATINYNYYVNVLVAKFKVEDSITNYLKNVVQPIRDSLIKRTEFLNLTISNKRALEKTYYDTLLVVNEYNILARSAHAIKLRQSGDFKISSLDSIKLAQTNTAYIKAEPILKGWIVTNQTQQTQQLNSSLANITKSIAEQRAIINSRTATINQKNNAQSFLNSLLVQYKSDSTRLATNIVAANGGPIFNYPGKLEMHQVSKYIPTSQRNTDSIYARILRFQNTIIEANANILQLQNISISSPSEFNRRVREENNKKSIAQDNLNIEITRGVPVIAFSLLNNPTKATADLFLFRNVTNNFEPVSKSIDTAQAWLDRAITFLEDSITKATDPNNLGNVKSAEDVLVMQKRMLRPADNPKFWGSFLLKIDIKNSCATLGMEVFASIDQGGVEVIKGSMNDFKKAGTLELLITKNEFKLSIGQKSAPCSVEASFSSFMTGLGTFYLEVNNKRTNTASSSSNFSIDFGISARVTKGGSLDLGVAELYAYISGGVSLNATAKRYTNLNCTGNNANDGFNGWYGNATLTVDVAGKVGIRNKVFDLTIGSGSVRATLLVYGPTPLYFKGTIRVHVNVLGINGTHEVSMEYGSVCVGF